MRKTVAATQGRIVRVEVAAKKVCVMKAILLPLFVGLVLVAQEGLAMNNSENSRQVRTYMPYSVPIDPVKMVLIPDMDLSYALGGTLVEWGKNKSFVSAVAKKWEPVNEKTIRFTIRSGLKWSDGSLLVADQIKRSFERALKKYPEDLRSLGNILVEIRCPTSDTIDFVLNVDAEHSNLLGKLTEPNYGVLKITDSGELDLTKTTGPFYIEKQTESGLTLKRNPNWFHANTEMPEEVVIRRPGNDFDSETILLKDSWANMIETSSMIRAENLAQYEKGHFQIWKRPLDKMGLFQLSKNSANVDGFALVRYLRKNLDRKKLFQGLEGFEPTDQAFPRGYQLHDLHFKCDDDGITLPEKYKKHPVRIVYSPARINPVLRANIGAELERVTGVKPTLISIPLQDVGSIRKKGDFDFYAGTIGMADPDPEGIMSYYFEGDLPMVQPSSEDYVEKLDHARKETDREKRLKLMTGIMTDATCKGHVLPLYHVSTVGIGRPELDFNNVPLTDESITLSKIRFKAGAK